MTNRFAEAAHSFHEVLDRLIRRQPVSAKDLAQRSGVSAATISRWRRGVELPPLRSRSLAALVAEMEIRVEDRAELDRAHQASWDQPRPQDREEKASVERIFRPMRSTSNLPRDERESSTSTLKSMPSAVQTRTDVLKMALALLDAAPELRERQDAAHTISLTFQGAWGLWADSPDGRERWLGALRKVLNKGWNVEHLWRISRRSAPEQVEAMLRLLGSHGRYSARYLTPNEPLVPPHDLLLIPGLGAVLMLATQQWLMPDTGDDTHLNAAIFLDARQDGQREQVAVLQAYFDLLRKGSHPVFVEYDVENDGLGAFDKLIADIESKDGGRLMVRDALPAETRPRDWHHVGSVWADTMEKSDVRMGLPVFLASREKRVLAFEEKISRFTNRDIIPQYKLRDFIENGTLTRSFAPRHKEGKAGKLPLAERIEWLENVLRLMEKSGGRYEIALLGDQELGLLGDPKEPQSQSSYWMVIDSPEGRRALMRTSHQGNNNNEVRRGLDLQEPTIVAALAEYFDQRLWRRISPIHRNQEYVRLWFRDQIRALKERQQQGADASTRSNSLRNEES